MRYSRCSVLTVPAGLVVLLVATARPMPAQAARQVSVETDLVKDPGGTQLAHIPAGTRVAVGAANGDWVQATLDGWIAASALHDEKRGGFDVGVNLPAGTPVREHPGAGAILASARAGALFTRVEMKNGWVHVRRTGWIPAKAIAPGVPHVVVAPPPAAPPVKPPPSATTTVNAGATLAAQAGGSLVATLESPLGAEVLERRSGWAHVRIDAWVHEAALGNAPAPGAITAAEIRAAPEKFVGQTVEWTVQVLGIQKADELRPELPPGQPYVLARGPLPESGFLYIAITNDEADSFRRLEPLAKIRIRATIRAGRSRFLPTPVLNFVRRLDQE